MAGFHRQSQIVASHFEALSHVYHSYTRPNSSFVLYLYGYMPGYI